MTSTTTHPTTTTTTADSHQAAAPLPTAHESVSIGTTAAATNSTAHAALKHDLAAGNAQVVLNPADRPIPDVLQNIVNFRDVGKNYNADIGADVLKVGNLFRSGRLDDATTDDLTLLTDMFHIKTVIDLRSETEGKMGEEVVNTFPASAINEQTRLAEIVRFLPPPIGKTPPKDSDVDDESGDDDDEAEMARKAHDAEKAHDVDGSNATAAAAPAAENAAARAPSRPRVTYYVNFAGSSFRRNSVWKPLRFSSKLKVIGLMAMHQKPRVVTLVGSEVINPAGLNGLNEAFLAYCGPEIIRALRLMSVPRHYPLLVHCTQGKDRTGLVIALALHCAGASLDLIALDYARTQRGLERQRAVMVEEMRKTGLDPVFSDAPVEVIRHVWDVLEKQYGGPDAYLDRHGFNATQRARLAACLKLVAEPAQTANL
ncbi:hypothetical protein HDU87_005188 [Geranomyces variabilis]|uniref:Tyrosine specific protein phosphatases domain-containing protein n=1 Tax=Geranomyces variabilis TaxID=109894 RepID=A0AAD5TJM7_9FUNG|nr:hypothetical protein HDU87_005188 [Geranomyces variabilis]